MLSLFGGLLLHELLHLLELCQLLHLQHIERIGSWGHSAGTARSTTHRRHTLEPLFGLLLHHVAGLGGNDTELLHELDDGHFHLLKDAHHLRIGHDN